MRRFSLQTVFIMIIAILFEACGYKPSAAYARAVVGEKVSTSVVISKEDPENSVLIKDAVDGAVVTVFHSSLVPKSQSESHLVIRVSNPSYTPVQYDQNGFVIAYRMRVILYIDRYTNGMKRSYTARGYYDFSVTPNAVITDQQRFEAIRYAAQKAIVAYVNQIAAEGVK